MASLTRNFVASATNSLPDKTRETVDLETPARRATSTIVTRPTRSAESLLGAEGIRPPIFLDRSKTPKDHKNSRHYPRYFSMWGCAVLAIWNVTIERNATQRDRQ